MVRLRLASNCTNMELKCDNVFPKILAVGPSNCTNMELK